MNTDSFNTIASYLALRSRDLPHGDPTNPPIDLTVLLGSSLVQPILLAADIINAGVSGKLLVSGGVGHSTQDLRDSIDRGQFSGIATKDRPEADIIADILVERLGVDASKIIIENQSTNCGTNAEESRRVLDKEGVSPTSILLIQDPTMQRRSQACFERAWADRRQSIDIVSYAPFIPRLELKEDGTYAIAGSDFPSWEYERLASLILGEVPRLRDDENGYGPRGKDFFDHIKIPGNVEQAFDELSEEMAKLVRKIPS
ncbi:MAG: hypothetical protein QG623_463 [Patescibacteria group bacterium]|nr:hypothetical protein [Patescibacteria group bacterium]